MKSATPLFCSILLIGMTCGACAHDDRPGRYDAPVAPYANYYYGPVTNYYGPVYNSNGPAGYAPDYGDQSYSGPPNGPGYGYDAQGGYGPAPYMQAWGPAGYPNYGYQPPSDPYYENQRLDPWAGYNGGPNNGY